MLGDETNERSSGTAPQVTLPDDFSSKDTFLAAMRQLFYDDIQYDRLNREAALEDLRFMVADQYDDVVRQRREAARKPCLTFNRLPAFVAQVIGNRRMSETSIKCLPDNGGTVEIARVREGLIRNIQKNTLADVAYDTAMLGSVACGIGNFRVRLDYDSDDVFEQSILIEQLPDALATVWDRELIDGTGRDAKHVFVVRTMTKKDFYKEYPWATPADMMVDVTLRGDLRMNGWIAVDDVRIVEFWRMRTRKRTLALFTDNTVRDVTDEDDVTQLANIATHDDGTPIIREVNRKYAQMYLCSGLDILEGPYELPISRVPVFRVPGWEVFVGQWKHRWGLVRFLKDPQRLHNYWRSVIAEKLQQTPRAVWLAADTAVAGREKDYRNSHLSDNPLLIWSAESGAKPERLAPAQMEEALIAQAEMTTQDIKDISNIHEANLGAPSNEVSGVAIMARQRVSDIGSAIYQDNLAHAIEECGRVINDLIPVVYDTPRTIKVLGDDGRDDVARINDPKDPESQDITLGKYAISVVNGPSTATKRIEASENMMNFINAMPQFAGLVADLIVESQDWPMAQEFAKRIRSQLPPGVLDPKDMSPEQLQAAQQQGQQQQAITEMQFRQMFAEWMKTQSEAALNSARAHNFETGAVATAQRADTEAFTAQSQAQERELAGQLDAVRTAHDGG